MRKPQRTIIQILSVKAGCTGSVLSYSGRLNIHPPFTVSGSVMKHITKVGPGSNTHKSVFSKKKVLEVLIYLCLRIHMYVVD